MFDFVSAGFCRGNSVGNDQQRRMAMSCEGCSVKFTVFKRRRQCSICQRHYCTHCLPLGGQNGGSNSTASVLARFTEKKLKCNKCKVLTARPLCRSQLRQLRVKDLQLYLTSQQVSTRGCVEKDDLVNLLIRHAGGASNNPQRNEAYCGQSSQSDLQSGDQTCQNLQETRLPGQSSPSTSDTPHNINTTGAEANERASESRENNTTSDQEGVVSSERVSPEITCHVSTSSSSSSSYSEEGQCEQASSSSSSGVDIVEMTDWMGGNNNPDCCGPEPVVTVLEEDSSSVSSAMSVSDLPADVTSAPNTQTEEETPMEFEEIAAETSNVSDNINETSEEFLGDVTEEAEEEPFTTAQACTGITLSSIDSVEDLEKLTVKQLKELLSLNRVDYRGCCEKPELVERVTRLWQEDNQARKVLDKMTMDELCKICMDAPVECVMLECGHMATCTACGKQLSECPICRQFVVRVVRTFRS